MAEMSARSFSAGVTYVASSEAEILQVLKLDAPSEYRNFRGSFIMARAQEVDFHWHADSFARLTSALRRIGMLTGKLFSMLKKNRRREFRVTTVVEGKEWYWVYTK